MCRIRSNTTSNEMYQLPPRLPFLPFLEAAPLPLLPVVSYYVHHKVKDSKEEVLPHMHVGRAR